MLENLSWLFPCGSLFLIAVLFLIFWKRKDDEINDLKKENRILRNGINLASRIIGESNVLHVSPKELPKDLDDFD